MDHPNDTDLRLTDTIEVAMRLIKEHSQALAPVNALIAAHRALAQRDFDGATRWFLILVEICRRQDSGAAASIAMAIASIASRLLRRRAQCWGGRRWAFPLARVVFINWLAPNRSRRPGQHGR